MVKTNYLIESLMRASHLQIKKSEFLRIQKKIIDPALTNFNIIFCDKPFLGFYYAVWND